MHMRITSRVLENSMATFHCRCNKSETLGPHMSFTEWHTILTFNQELKLPKEGKEASLSNSSPRGKNYSLLPLLAALEHFLVQWEPNEGGDCRIKPDLTHLRPLDQVCDVCSNRNWPPISQRQPRATILVYAVWEGSHLGFPDHSLQSSFLCLILGFC